MVSTSQNETRAGTCVKLIALLQQFAATTGVAPHGQVIVVKSGVIGACPQGQPRNIIRRGDQRVVLQRLGREISVGKVLAEQLCSWLRSGTHAPDGKVQTLTPIRGGRIQGNAEPRDGFGSGQRELVKNAVTATAR